MKYYVNKKTAGAIDAASRGQMIIEYAVMFAVIVAVIIGAALFFVQPAVNGFFGKATNIINASIENVEP